MLFVLYNVHLGGGDCFGCLVFEHFSVVRFVGTSEVFCLYQLVCLFVSFPQVSPESNVAGGVLL